jgi:hypothetical protein
MLARTALIGVVTVIASVLVSSVQGATPSDAHDRAVLARELSNRASSVVPRDASGRSVEATLRDSHDHVVLQPTVETTPRDAHDRQPAPQQPIAAVGSRGLDWGDAAIGALGGIALALLLGGAALLATSRRTRTRVAIR